MAMNKSQGVYVTRQSRSNSATFFMTSHLYVPDLFKTAAKNFGSGYKKSVWFSGQKEKNFVLKETLIFKPNQFGPIFWTLCNNSQRLWIEIC